MVTTDTLESYYECDENAANTTVADAHGSNTGTSSTNTANLYNADGIINSSFDFTASSSEKIDLGTMGSFGSNLDNGFSLSFWIKTTSSAQMTLFSVNTGATELLFITMNEGAADDFRIALRDVDDVLVIGRNTAINLNDGAWHHMVVTVDGPAGVVTMYVDSVSKTASYIVSGTPDNFVNFENSAFISGLYGGSAFMDGQLDEIGIFNSILSQTDVDDLYGSGTPPPYPFAVGTNLQLNIGDAWKEISAGQINIGDAWKTVGGIQINIGDVWKEVF